jgi:hypothetical protein
MSMISAHQIRALRTVASARFGPCSCAAGRCDYHDWLAGTFAGVASTKDLTHDQASWAIDHLSDRPRQRPARAPKVQQRYTGRGGKNLSQRQADYIAGLEDQLGWTADPSRLAGMIERQIGAKATVEMLTPKRATKLITGLKALLKDRQRKATA